MRLNAPIDAVFDPGARQTVGMVIAFCIPGFSFRIWAAREGSLQPEQDRMSTTRSNDSSLGAPALIDDVATAALAADVGPASLVTVLLAFCDELQRRAPLLKVALEDADLAAIGRETHSIKGSALTFGAAALGAAARRANDASRSGDAATALASGREVLALMPETRAAVARLAEQTAEVQQ
jgi:HPt (histidine-containing phosphotransfer) domain-containing protein